MDHNCNIQIYMHVLKCKIHFFSRQYCVLSMENYQSRQQFFRWCFVTVGVVLNMAQMGVCMGYAATLLPQLRAPDSYILIEDASGSWIAAIIGVALLPGNFMTPFIMDRYGRRTANIVSIVSAILGWFIIIGAKSIQVLLFARCLQGFSIGISSTVGPIIIGECSSPKNRGPFLSTASLGIGSGILFSHIIGLYLSWQKTALICGLLSFCNLLIVIYCPETPSWLLSKGRIEDCERTFRWLRGDRDDDELKSMIDAKNSSDKDNVREILPLKEKLRRSKDYWISTVNKNEFYKPIVIIVHLYTTHQWAGGNVLAAYAVDAVHIIVGKEYVRPIIISVGVQRLVSSTIAIFMIRKIKRRNILHIGVFGNVAVMLLTAAYTYLKSHNLLPYDHISIGILLLHLHMFMLAVGPQTMPYIIAGEIFPLEYRSLSSALGVISLTPNLILCVKTMPFLFSTIQLYGSYILYSIILGYCWIVVAILLPETKDRTLLDIEDEFRGLKREPEKLLE